MSAYDPFSSARANPCAHTHTKHLQDPVGDWFRTYQNHNSAFIAEESGLPVRWWSTTVAPSLYGGVPFRCPWSAYPSRWKVAQTVSARALLTDSCPRAKLLHRFTTQQAKLNSQNLFNITSRLIWRQQNGWRFRKSS